MRPSVLIVDDHEDFRASASALLELQGFDVVAAVGDGEAALAAVERLRPDLVLLDVQLPGLDGFDVAERLAAYNLLSVPVCDESGFLLGTVTVDDVLDRTLPVGWRTHQ